MDENPALSNEASSSPSPNGLGNGFVIWLLLLIVVGLLLGGITATLPGGPGGTMVFVMFQPGLWQLLFVIPALVLLRRQKKFESAKGLLISASVLFILDAICSGSLFLGSLGPRR